MRSSIIIIKSIIQTKLSFIILFEITTVDDNKHTIFIHLWFAIIIDNDFNLEIPSSSLCTDDVCYFSTFKPPLFDFKSFPFGFITMNFKRWLWVSLFNKIYAPYQNFLWIFRLFTLQQEINNFFLDYGAFASNFVHDVSIF